uniref:Uncharacterized protein n=1 Tax=Panagrolaimus davidi TaxID=227884 RepID=A0A914PQZ9_9BILA
MKNNTSSSSDITGTAVTAFSVSAPSSSSRFRSAIPNLPSTKTGKEVTHRTSEVYQRDFSLRTGRGVSPAPGSTGHRTALEPAGEKFDLETKMGANDDTRKDYLMEEYCEKYEEGKEEGMKEVRKEYWLSPVLQFWVNILAACLFIFNFYQLNL